MAPLAQSIAFTGAALGMVPPDRSPFAPPKPVTEAAQPIDRLAALLGRSVQRIQATFARRAAVKLPGHLPVNRPRRCPRTSSRNHLAAP